MEQHNFNHGYDQNIFNAENIFFSSSDAKLPRLRRLKTNEHFINYALTLLSLAWYLITWTVLGLIAKSEFPTGYVWDLLVACIKGTEVFSETISSEQSEIYRLNKNALRARRNSESENSRLNKLKSKIIVLEDVIKRLYKDNERKQSSIDQVLQGLEKRKDFIEIDLEPLKQEYDFKLYKLERAFHVLLEGKDSAEKDYKNVEGILREVIEKYKVETESPSTESALQLIEGLQKAIRDNPKNIRLSRLELLNYTLTIIRWIFFLEGARTQPDSTKSTHGAKAETNETETDLADLLDADAETSDSTNWINAVSSEIRNFYEPDQDLEDLLDIETLIDDEFYQHNDIDLSEVVEKPYGDFINKAWLDLIKSIVDRAISETTETTQDWIESIKLGIEKEWINRISVYGFDSYTGKSKVELALSIDWDNQNVSYYQGTDSQKINLDELIFNFIKFSSAQECVNEWRVQYTHPETTDFYNKELGFERAALIEWATNGGTTKAPAKELEKLFFELNFGPNKHQTVTRHNTTDTSGIGNYFLAICVVFFLVSISWSMNQRFPDVPDVPAAPRHDILKEEFYLEELHRSISAWDVQSARRHLAPLTRSQDLCISEFALRLNKSLDSKSEKGFQDVNAIKRALNDQYPCSLEITPYEFSP